MNRSLIVSDITLIAATAAALITSIFVEGKWLSFLLAALSFLGLVPVAISAVKSLWQKCLSVDLLASIALIFSLITSEWKSAAFITLMLTFARVFESITDSKVKRIIQSLLKYNVEDVRIKKGDSISDVKLSAVRPGDLVIIDAGDRVPVDGVVVSGEAEIDESTLTGESETVGKKPGDKVFTSTMNQSGSLVVRTEKIGEDTTLARIVKLVDESSRQKNKAERMANRFTQWYIFLSLTTAVVMYLFGLSTREILAVLLVTCADDIAVAVPLGFTAAISRAAKRGVMVKGSGAMESLSKLKYILTDKTGTLTRGKPKVVDIHVYGTFARHKVVGLAMMGASESKHTVSRAITEYGRGLGLDAHAPQEFEEISGRGVKFKHGIDEMLLGRPSFLATQKVHISEEIMKEIHVEKDAGRGVAVLAVNHEVAGVIAYTDELRPHAREIIAETRQYGIKEWHMLTGDNEHAAAAVARELNIRHFHANMTPESKVDFVHTFERDHEPAVVAYIGDGVNDAASLALADVSIAMGGIGAEAAIEAADITIMKDHLGRIPEVMKISKSAMRIMWQNFGIWAITNVIGLALVGAGFIGPVGAAAYNFLTDFIPIGNALRAGRK